MSTAGERLIAQYDAVAGSAAAPLAAILALGLPGPRDENWRYANLRPLDRAAFAPPPRRCAGSATAEALPSQTPSALPGFHRIVLVDGRLAVPAGSLPAGLQLAPRPAGSAGGLPDAAADERHPDLRFAAINRAFGDEPLALTVEAGASAAVELLCVATVGASEGSSHPSLRVELGAGAQLQLLERHAAGSDAATFANPLLEVNLARGARCDHQRMQSLASRATLVGTLGVAIGEGAQYRLATIDAGAASSRLSARVALQARGAIFEHLAVAALQGTQVCDTSLRVAHLAPEGRSAQRFRAVCTGRARAAFNGHAVVSAEGAGSQVEQSLRALLEGIEAEADLRPQLEIYTDDIRASHGATVGTLDESMKFYMMSRGLDADTAAALLKWAFVGDVLSRIGPEAVRRAAERALAPLLPGLDAFEVPS